MPPGVGADVANVAPSLYNRADDLVAGRSAPQRSSSGVDGLVSQRTARARVSGNASGGWECRSRPPSVSARALRNSSSMVVFSGSDVQTDERDART